MVHLTALWLPILLSVVAVFIASSVIWMVLPIHKNDYKKLGDKESTVLAALRSWGLGPGVYMFPGCDHATMKEPATIERMKAGPWGTITLMPEMCNMGKTLGLWALNLLIISVLVGYVAAHALPINATFLNVFQIVFTVALLAHGGNVLCDSIWKGRPWSHLPGSLFDALVYAALTGAAFGWLWPQQSLLLPGT